MKGEYMMRLQARNKEMKKYFLVLIGVTTLGVGQVAAGLVQPEPHPAERLSLEEMARAVVQEIDRISQSDAPSTVRRDQIANLISELIRAAGPDAEELASLLAALLPTDQIGVVTAAAVLAAGERSPDILRKLLEGAPDEPAREHMLAAVQNPARVLGAETAGKIVARASEPVEPMVVDGDMPAADTMLAAASRDIVAQFREQQEPQPAASTEVQSAPADEPTATDEPATSEAQPLGPPPRPLPAPPRPPAAPYRGQ